MVHIDLSVPESYKEKFDYLANITHLSKSELLRRWIDNALTQNESNNINKSITQKFMNEV